MKTTRTLSQRRRLAGRTHELVRLARESRKALVRVIELVSVRSTEVLALSETGDPIFDYRKLTEEERIQRLQIALTWLQKSEQLNLQLRALIERGLEREWKSV